MPTLYRLGFCADVKSCWYSIWRVTAQNLNKSFTHIDILIDIVQERLAEGFWYTKSQFLFWIFTSVSVGSSPRSYSSTNTRSHCEKEWQKPIQYVTIHFQEQHSLDSWRDCCARRTFLAPELPREARAARENWLVPTLLAAPPPKQYSTPMLISPATQAKKSAVQLRSVQKLRRNHRSYMWTEALSGMVSPAQKITGTVWTLYKNEIIIGHVVL